MTQGAKLTGKEICEEKEKKMKGGRRES